MAADTDAHRPPMKQVPLPLVPDAVGRFETYLPGPNAAAVAALQAELPPRAPVYLWGETGSGKTHLLQAAAHVCEARGTPAAWYTPLTPLPWAHDARVPLPVFDDVHRFDAEQQRQAFALCVEAQAHGCAWLAAGDRPPVDLPLRDDLRTRLGWGQVHALHPLGDDQTLAALEHEAARRGITLSPEVAHHVLSRFTRDLSSLMRLIDRLDRYSLAERRAVTVPLLRAMLADDDPDAGRDPRTESSPA